MKKTIKTEKVLALWRVLGQAKYTKMEDADKIKVWKIGRVLKPIAEKFEDESKDAAEKLKPMENFDELLQNAQEFERVTKTPKADASELKMGAAEYGAFLKELQNYNKLVSEAVKGFADKEVEVEFEPISEEAFGKLMNSNDWTFNQVVDIELIMG
jgi:hypothetical protein